MNNTEFSLSQPLVNSIEVNRVLRNTYFLLSLTLLFSAGAAWFAMSINAQPLNLFVLIVGMLGLSFLTMATRNSGWGILSIFLFTGFMGYSIGPILNLYIKGFTNGAEIVTTALGATGVIFIGLSAYTLVSRKNFSYLGGFISIGILIAFIAGVGAAIFQLPMLQLLVSGAFALFSAGYILFTTSAIIHGGERNYIMATITLYVAIFNLFVSLLNILSFFGGNRN